MQLLETPEPWPMVLKHGILKERFGDILTDAIRAQILRIMGYRTEIIEFVGDEHTPRNIMIRAVKTQAPLDQTAVNRYKDLVNFWNLTPKLSQLVKLPI